MKSLNKHVVLNSLREESRMVFRKLGFVMIYAVVSESSLSVPAPLSPLNTYIDK